MRRNDFFYFWRLTTFRTPRSAREANGQRFERDSLEFDKFLTLTLLFSWHAEFVQNHAPTIAVPECNAHRCVRAL